MLMPTMRTNVFDDLFNNPFFTKSESSMMKTDIKEHDNCYDLMIDLPGVKKEDIKAELNDGYLTVSAESNTSKRREGRQRQVHLPRTLFRQLLKKLLCRRHSN